MGNIIQPYIEVIFNERAWSWALLGIVYILIGLSIRGVFLNSLSRRLNGMNKHLVHDIKRGYLRRSIVGWLLFLTPMVIFIIFWSRPSIFPITTSDFSLFCVAIASFFLSIMLHLQAFGVATLDAIRKAAEKESSLGL